MGGRAGNPAHLISHGTTFLFAIYQLSKGCEYIANTFVAPCKLCVSDGAEFTD